MNPQCYHRRAVPDAGRVPRQAFYDNGQAVSVPGLSRFWFLHGSVLRAFSGPGLRVLLKPGFNIR
jgi:hypothetical protein